MQYLSTYLNKIVERGNVKLAESIFHSAEEIGRQHLCHFSFLSHEIGLLLGDIQSGKTAQMFGVICKAVDLGFPVFILLTTDNVLLQQQTLKRAKSDLEGFCICGENDSGLFIENNLIKPAIIILKKNFRVLKLWANVINSTGFIKGNPLFIIDDEADAASLNTLINKNQKSSINKNLDSIKNGVFSSLYLQVTATPQALYLQTLSSGWHPYFTYYFQPGDEYLGGNFFFPKTGKPDCVTFLDFLQKPTRNVILRHLAVSSQIFLSGGNVSNCLLHPSVRQIVHKRYSEYIRKELNWCIENIDDEFVDELKNQYDRFYPTTSKKFSFDEILDKAKDLLMNKKIKVLIMNSKFSIESSDYSSGCNIIIGGNTLSRGVTFPGLQTIYYTRSSKKPQADTMWQHSRMFGYDRDPGMMMVYIDRHLYKLFSDINATNNSIIAQINHGIQNVKIYYPEGLNPTRKNVLDNNYLETISGGTNYYPENPRNDSIEQLSLLLESFSEKEPYYQVNLRFIKDILNHIIPSSDFNLLSFISIIDKLLSENPVGQCILIVRRDRDITQGTGALLSPNDWQLGSRFTDKVVLTIYQVTGTKGWGGQPVWVPNIKLPHGMIYYDVIEDYRTI